MARDDHRRFGSRPFPRPIEAITQLHRPSTMEEVRVLLVMVDSRRKFVPNNNSVLAPISDFLRDSRFSSKNARHLKVPESQTKTEEMKIRMNLPTSPPIMDLPDWNKLFWLYTDASEAGAGAVLTQIQEIVEKPLACASHP